MAGKTHYLRYLVPKTVADEQYPYVYITFRAAHSLTIALSDTLICKTGNYRVLKMVPEYREERYKTQLLQVD